MTSRTLSASGAVAAVLLLSGCSGVAAPEPSPTPTDFTLNGSISVPFDFDHALDQADGEDISLGGPCRADGGYDDIVVGGQVVIQDAGGETIALGELGPGAVDADAGDLAISANCLFNFRVLDVPLGESFYGVEIGNSNRGVVQYTYDQARAGANLVLGD